MDIEKAKKITQEQREKNRKMAEIARQEDIQKAMTGIIEKDDLKIGIVYKTFRNTRNIKDYEDEYGRAKWNGEMFEYFRYKFGWRIDTMNHFIDVKETYIEGFAPHDIDEDQTWLMPE